MITGDHNGSFCYTSPVWARKRRDQEDEWPGGSASWLGKGGKAFALITEVWVNLPSSGSRVQGEDKDVAAIDKVSILIRNQICCLPWEQLYFP